MTKFIEDLKARGYVEGDMSTIPNDLSDSDRTKVEQHEADLANEAVKHVQGQKPVLHEQHVELNPNQYGFAETDIAGDDTTQAKRKAVKRAPVEQEKPKPIAKDDKKE